MTETVDLLVIGAGPAGLSCAINGASEGLRVRILDDSSALGGQARSSSAIENYPGFPAGVTGDELMTRLVEQAHKFGTMFSAPCRAASLTADGGWLHVTADDYSDFAAKAVLLANGLNYRRLDADGVDRFMGRGIWYGAPSTARHRRVTVVGGANSAGQAALHLSKGRDVHVTMLARSPLDRGMSTYLIERILACENIDVKEGAELVSCEGTTGRLHTIHYRLNAETVSCECEAVYVYIGAVPRTLWLRQTVALDPANYVLTAPDLSASVSDIQRPLLPFETSLPNVFAAGDVRSGSTKRIAAAIGEGATALQMIHRAFAV